MNWLFLLGILLPLNSMASAVVKLNSDDLSDLNALEQQKVQQFIDQSLQQLPPKILTIISGIVEVRFSEILINNEDPAAFGPPLCLDIEKLTLHLKDKVANEFDGTSSSTPPKAENIRGGIYGKTEKSFWSHSYKIFLNKHFLPVILERPGVNVTYPCGHRDMKKLATATFIHELAHVYDNENYPATHNSEEIRLRLKCQSMMNGPKAQPPPWCQHLLSQRHSISDRPSWKNLLNWNAGVFSKQSENQLGVRSPDFYENTSLAEAFAVNTEYFLMDPEYSCRRPEYYEYLSQHLGFLPFSNSPCAPQTEITYSAKKSKIDLHWKNLYEIHYLMADKGEEFESSFGHAMFRLVFCDPKKLAKSSKPNSECIKDQQHHIVLSFRASINGLTTDKLKGLTGQYPSQIFVYPLGHIISEYTVSQFRNLKSIPLKLSEAEKRHFIQRTLQMYWEYQSKYYFIGNNCATEALNFIKGVVFRPKVQEHDTGIETPQSVYNFLKENDLLDESKANTEPIEGRYFFTSYGHQINENLKQLGLMTKSEFKTIYDITEQYSSEDRLQLYKSLKQKLTVESDMKDLAIHFYRLERAISVAYGEYKQELLNEKLIVDPSRAPAAPSYRQNIRHILIERSQLAPWLMTTSGYGIPSSSERISDAKISAIYESINKSMLELDASLMDDNPDIYAEISKINLNLNYFFNEIKNHMGSK